MFIDIVGKINKVDEGNYAYLPEFDAYAICANGYRGIAIDAKKEVVINEHFNNAHIQNFMIKINNKIRNVIFLYTLEEYLSQQYASVCFDFIDLEKRNINATNPLLWFEQWKELMGNTIKNKVVFDVLGEMKILLELLKKNKNPKWKSIDCGTFDILSDNAVFEVKTTKSKTRDLITIHNQFQLDVTTINNPLFIAYCKVEENDAGVCIDDVYNQLIENGFNKNVLDEYLNKMNYFPGKTERYIKYCFNEIRFYKVDEKFPKIIKDSFVDGKIPVGIVNYQYTVSLDGLSYICLEEI